MPADPRRAKDIFAAAIDLPPAERAAFLDRECDGELRARVEALLAAHDAPASALDRPLAQSGTAAYTPTETPGMVVAGRYKLLELIGEGGMGEVWVADQLEPIKRRVALKLIKPGMDTRSVLARFEAERQALALMDHPNIAKVLDAGTTEDGRPYFVMELVKGTPITTFCDARKLTPNERLELFVPVCQAIQHAHHKGIIHRDIKPTNVLVALHDEKPVPKVIDFGVAKAVGQQLTERTLYTGFGALVGTPAYMAPEQATFNQLDIDTRADVYALGVLLYELLAGSPPVEPERLKAAALDEVLRLVREEEPQRPSARLSTSQAKASIAATRQSDPVKLSALIRGELDWIVMKALEKDRTRRYETANGLSKDVERYLRGDAVEACPPTLGYRLRKAYRRNLVAVWVTGLFVLFVACSAAISLGLALVARRAEVEAARQRDAAEVARADAVREQERAAKAEEQARREAAAAKAVREFLQNDLLLQAPILNQAEALHLRGGGFVAKSNPTVHDLLDRAAAQLTPEKLQAKFPDLPLVQAEILKTVGEAYSGIDEFDKARIFLERAIELYRKTGAADHRDALSARYALGQTYLVAGRSADGRAMLKAVAADRASTLGPFHRDTFASRIDLAAMTSFSEAVTTAPVLERLRAEAVEHLGPDDDLTLLATYWFGVSLSHAGQHHAAVPHLERVRDAVQQMNTSPNHPYALSLKVGLGTAYRHTGRMDAAIALHREACDGLSEVYGGTDIRTWEARHILGWTYLSARRPADAVAVFEANLSVGRRPPMTTMSLTALAHAYRLAGRTRDAINLLEPALKQATAKGDLDDEGVSSITQRLAEAYQADGRPEEAIEMLEVSLEKIRTALGQTHAKSLQVGMALGYVLEREGRYARAVEVVAGVVAARRTRREANPAALSESLYTLGRNLLAADRVGEAAAAFREALAIREKTAPIAWDTAALKTWLGAALLRLKKLPEAESLLLSGYAEMAERKQRMPTWGIQHPAWTAARLVELYTARGKHEEADRWRAEQANSPAVAPAPRVKR